MEKITGIYKITSPTGRIYIGQSIHILRRFGTYKRLACKQQGYLYNSFIKHGVENHKFEIIHRCCREELNQLEVHYIQFFKTLDKKYGLNIHEGGNSKKMAESTKDKLRKINLGKKMSEDQIKNMSIRIKAEWANGIRKSGYKLSDEIKKRMSDRCKGKAITVEAREKLRQAHTGKTLSEEHRRKISISMMGKKSHLGFKHSEETKRIISQKKSHNG